MRRARPPRSLPGGSSLTSMTWRDGIAAPISPRNELLAPPLEAENDNSPQSKLNPNEFDHEFVPFLQTPIVAEHTRRQRSQLAASNSTDGGVLHSAAGSTTLAEDAPRPALLNRITCATGLSETILGCEETLRLRSSR